MHDVHAEWIFMIVVISEFVIPKLARRSRNKIPNCCKTGNVES